MTKKQENPINTLEMLEPGMSATITEVGGDGALRQHFLDMGLIPGERVSMIKYAPMGDPMELRISGYELTLRKADAAKIKTKDVGKSSEKDEIDPAESVTIGLAI